ncbi:MAG TPA: TonB-dependent receptor plug domain-containing protein, partial [Longimicrobiales bacterium]|nr:TonB-dependent receptor plug domain-containing protein [Longimicrobiales bacterium]
MFHTRRLHGWGLAIAAILLPAGLSAQISTTISGVVRSETQSPVRGAFVQITSLNLSTVTNDGGYYRLVVPSTAGGTLTISVTSIGFKPVERQVGLRPGNMQLDFTMAEQAVVLNEVVVTGTAGRQERRAQAAVVSTISAAKVVEAAPVQNVANLLQARTPGVVIRNNSGSTGTSSTIRIRGQASIELSNEPLIFINGIRMQGGDRQLFGVGNQAGGFLNDIKIEDIESIEIVKGPAAATLYGADANAGVINVITKRGRTQSGWTQSVSMEYGQSEPAFTPPDNVARCTAADQAPNRATVFPACQ